MPALGNQLSRYEGIVADAGLWSARCCVLPFGLNRQMERRAETRNGAANIGVCGTFILMFVQW